MASKPSKSFKEGRESDTGRFIPVEEARRRPNTTTVEHVPKPGFGTEKKK